MFRVRLSCSILASVLLFAGCSQTPTSPSATPTAPLIGAVPQASPPLPPRLSVTPPRAVGVTRFVAFGDSITWGAESAFDPRFLFAAANGGYVERLQLALNTYHSPQRFTVFNEGEPGELAINALTRFRAMLTARRPEAVLLLEGINDLNNDISPSRTAAGIRALLDAATAAGVPVIVATMYQTYEVTDPDGFARRNAAAVVRDYNAELRRVAAGRLNVHLLDLYPVMHDRRLVGNDGIHLNDDGFAVMASAFLTAIETAFPVRGSFQ